MRQSSFDKTKIIIAIVIVVIILLFVSLMVDMSGNWVDQDGDIHEVKIKSHSGYSTKYSVDTYILDVPFASSWISCIDCDSERTNSIYYDRFNGRLHISNETGTWKKLKNVSNDSLLSWRVWDNMFDTFEINGTWVGMDNNDDNYVVNINNKENSTAISGKFTQAGTLYIINGSFSGAAGSFEDEFGREWNILKNENDKLILTDENDNYKITLHKTY